MQRDILAKVVLKVTVVEICVQCDNAATPCGQVLAGFDYFYQVVAAAQSGKTGQKAQMGLVIMNAPSILTRKYHV